MAHKIGELQPKQAEKPDMKACSMDQYVRTKKANEASDKSHEVKRMIVTK